MSRKHKYVLFNSNMTNTSLQFSILIAYTKTKLLRTLDDLKRYIIYEQCQTYFIVKDLTRTLLYQTVIHIILPFTCTLSFPISFYCSFSIAIRCLKKKKNVVTPFTEYTH